MNVHEVIDSNLFDADSRSFDERLSRMITLEYAAEIYKEQQY
ncbi:hypothetical protein [Lederbergia lenta]|nr:hypothetical protein [Lederbergia lenta]